MLIDSPFEMNDWNIRRFLVLISSAICLYISILYLNSINLGIQIISVILCFFLMLLAPGLLILRILKAHHLGTLKTVIYSVALSLATVMLLAMAQNFLLPFAGVAHPMTADISITLLLALIAGLGTIAWLRDHDFINPRKIDTSIFSRSSSLALYLLPFMAIFSTFIQNTWGDNRGQYVLIIIISITFGAVFLVKNVSRETQAIALACISLSLVLHSALVSKNIVEWADVSFEIWGANQVIINGVWDPSMFERTNELASLTLIGPYLHFISGVDLMIVFKIIYPLLFPLIPMAVYAISRDRIGNREGLAAGFIIAASTIMYTEMLGLNRQAISEIFFLVVLMVLMLKDFRGATRSALVILMIVAMAMSHYGTLLIIGAIFCLSLTIYPFVRAIVPQNRKKIQKGTLSGYIVVITLISLCIGAWYFFILDSELTELIQRLFNYLLSGFSVMGPYNGTIMEMIFEHRGPWYWLDILTIATNALLIIMVIIGLTYLLYHRDKQYNLGPGYISVAIVSAIVSIAGLYSINIYEALSEMRLSHYCYLILALVVAIGGFRLFEGRKIRQKIVRKRIGHISLGVVLITFFLISSGCLNILVGPVYHFELSPKTLPRPNFTDEQIVASEFSIESTGYGAKYYANANMAFLMEMQLGSFRPFLGTSTPRIEQVVGAYYFLDASDKNGMLLLQDQAGVRTEKHLAPIDPATYTFFHMVSTIYTSDGTSVLYYNL